jgi:hypothetical protein
MNATTISPPSVYAKQKFLKRITLIRDNRIISYIDFESAANLREDSDFAENRLLQRIKVYSMLNNVAKLVKDFSLNYSYFTNTNNTFTKKRLRLDSLQEMAVGTGTVSKPPHRFEYNSTGLMPERYSYALDHWGYYNAAMTNKSLVPTIAFGAQESYGEGADREPNLAGASYGVLNKIRYPTGGSSVFEYELHDAQNNDSTTRLVGGLRIKRITDYASDGQKAIAKRYEYKLEDSTTSGNTTANYPVYQTRTGFIHDGYSDVNEIRDPDYSSDIKTVSSNSIFALGS